MKQLCNFFALGKFNHMEIIQVFTLLGALGMFL